MGMPKWMWASLEKMVGGGDWWLVMVVGGGGWCEFCILGLDNDIELRV